MPRYGCRLIVFFFFLIKIFFSTLTISLMIVIMVVEHRKRGFVWLVFTINNADAGISISPSKKYVY